MSSTHAIGVDLGGTKILAGVVTREGEVVRRHERMTSLESQEGLVAELETAIAEVLDDDVASIGLGVPGPLDLEGGRTYDMVNLPFHDFPLRDHMAERFGLPVGLDNDANAAAIAEWRVGAGRGVDNLIMLTLGTGLGTTGGPDGRGSAADGVCGTVSGLSGLALAGGPPAPWPSSGFLVSLRWMPACSRMSSRSWWNSRSVGSGIAPS